MKLLTPAANRAEPTESYLTPRLAQILEQYLVDLENGTAPSPEKLAADHPELAEPLLEFLASIDYLHRAATGSPQSPRGKFSAEPLGELGDYRIVRELGRGGMGVVYEAQQISLGRRVAIKVLPFAAVLDSRQLSRFKNEAQAAAQLQHPHIVPVFSVGCERGIHFYAMQFIDGQPLDRLVDELREVWGYGSAQSIATATTLPYDGAAKSDAEKSGGDEDRATGEAKNAAPTRPAMLSDTAKLVTGGAVPGSKSKRAYLDFAARTIAQIADALEHAHASGVVHRDVKPSNLLLDHSGKAWITDFGLAQFQAKANLTISGELVGTLRYMSPEQTYGKPGLVDQRTDIYSLGVTLYELLTLHPLFDGEDKQQLLRQVEHQEPTAPHRLNPAIPRDLETIVLKAIAKSRDDRYSTAQELADDLRRFLAGEPTLARRPTRAERAVKWLGRHSRWVAIGMTLGIMAIAGLTATTLMFSQQQARTSNALTTAKENFDRAEANFHRAREVVDRFCTRLAGQLAAVPGAESIRRELLQESLGYYRDFIAQADGDRALQAELATAYFRVGEINEQVGADHDALAAYQEAERLLAAAEADDKSKLEADLALCRNNLGLVQIRLGNPEQAEEYFRQAIDRQQKLAAKHADSLRYRKELALSYNNLGLLMSQTNRLTEALALYRQAIDLQRVLADAQPTAAEARSNLAASFNNLATLLSHDDVARASEAYATAITIQQQLAKEFPEVLQYQSDLALTYNNHGAIQGRSERTELAERSYRQAIALCEQLVQKAPLVVVFRRDLAVTHNNLGFLFSAHRRPDEAIEAFGEARIIFSQLVERYPQSPQHRSSLGGVHNNLGMTYEQLTRLAEAIQEYRAAIEQQRMALTDSPQVAQFRDFLSRHYFNLGRVLRAAGQHAEAAEAAVERGRLSPEDAVRLASVAGELAQAAAGLEGAAQTTCRTQALDSLTAAIAAGFQDRDHLLAAPELEHLRQEPRFQNILAQIKTADLGLSHPVKAQPANNSSEESSR